MKLAKQRYLCDVVIFNGPNAHQGVAMHSIVLRAESDLWNYDVEKRAETRKPDEQIEIRLKNDVEPECFKHILRYMYTGKIDVSISNVLDMQRAATALQVPEVISLCNDFLQLLFSGQNLVTLMSALKMIPGGETSELMEVARQRITQKMDLSSSKRGGAFKENAVLNSGLEELRNLLEDPAMEAQSELDKLVMALNWLNFDREKRMPQLRELLSLIDFTKMTESELVSVWEIDEIFRHHPVAKELLMKANLARALSAADVDGQKAPEVDLEAAGSQDWSPNQGESQAANQLAKDEK